MIGLELNVSELKNAGKTVFLAGSLQFPMSTAVHFGFFQILSLGGLHVGQDHFSCLYMAACCALCSTMIVLRMLQTKHETDTAAGKMSCGLLMFQDVWAVFFLGIQPTFSNPSIMGITRTLTMMGLLVMIAFVYSKYILPPVLKSASATTE